MARAPESILSEQSETPVFSQMLLVGSVEPSAVGEGIETHLRLVCPVHLLLSAAVFSR
ncbi:MAG TPA: hypothetical protein VH640_21065 [Bryobacteraceae bacterium]